VHANLPHGPRRNLFAFDEYRLVALEATLCQFPKQEKPDDSCSALTDRPDERLNVRDGSKAHFWREADIGQNRRSCGAGGQQLYQSDSLRTSIMRGRERIFTRQAE
jgi:hypothetical protein